MFEVGDLVLYNENICVVTQEDPIILAANTGVDIKGVDSKDITPVLKYNQVLDQMERSLLCISGQ